MINKRDNIFEIMDDDQRHLLNRNNLIRRVISEKYKQADFEGGMMDNAMMMEDNKPAMSTNSKKKKKRLKKARICGKRLTDGELQENND